MAETDTQDGAADVAEEAEVADNDAAADLDAEKKAAVAEAQAAANHGFAWENLSAVEKEALSKFRDASHEMRYGNGVEDVDLGTFDIKKITLKTRMDLHQHVENDTTKLLEAKVTERLRASIEELERLRNKSLTWERSKNGVFGQFGFEKHLKSQVKKLSTDAGIDAEISTLSSTKPDEAALISQLEELKKERAKIEKEERHNLIVAHETDAGVLDTDFSFLDQSNDPDKMREWVANSKFDADEQRYANDLIANGDFNKLSLGADEFEAWLMGQAGDHYSDSDRTMIRYLYESDTLTMKRGLDQILPPDEVAGWRKSEEMRLLLHHLRSPNYQQLLNGGEVRGVRTEGVYQSLRKENGVEADLEALKTEKGNLERQLGGRLKITFIDKDGLSAEKEFDGGVRLAVETQKDIVQRLKIALEKKESALKQVQNAEAQKIEKEWRDAKADEDKAKAAADLAAQALQSSKGGKQQVNNIFKGLSDTAVEASGTYEDKKNARLLKQDDMRAFARQHGVDFKPDEDWLRYFSEHFNADTVDSSSVQKEYDEAKSKYEKANANLGVLLERETTITTKVADLSKQITAKQLDASAARYERKVPLYRQKPADLLQALETEAAKVDTCRRYGFTETAELDKPENAHLLEQAAKIGKLSTGMKLASIAGGRQQKENTAMLEQLAERNKPWKAKLGDWMSQTTPKASAAIGQGFKDLGADTKAAGKGIWGFFGRELGRWTKSGAPVFGNKK